MLDKNIRKIIYEFVKKNHHLMSLQQMVQSVNKALMINIGEGVIRDIKTEIFENNDSQHPPRKVGRPKGESF